MTKRERYLKFFDTQTKEEIVDHILYLEGLYYQIQKKSSDYLSEINGYIEYYGIPLEITKQILEERGLNEELEAIIRREKEREERWSL